MGYVKDKYDVTLTQSIWSSCIDDDSDTYYTYSLVPICITGGTDTSSSCEEEENYVNYHNFQAVTGVDFTTSDGKGTPEVFSCMSGTSMVNVELIGHTVAVLGDEVKLSGLTFTGGGCIRMTEEDTVAENIQATQDFGAIEIGPVTGGTASVTGVAVGRNMDRIDIQSGGVVCDVEVAGGLASVNVGEGAVLEDLSGNTLVDPEDETASATAVTVAKGGIASKIDLEYAEIGVAGTLNDATIGSGNLTVFEGGTASAVYLSRGKLEVKNGATVYCPDLDNGAELVVEDGGTVVYPDSGPDDGWNDSLCNGAAPNPEIPEFEKNALSSGVASLRLDRKGTVLYREPTGTFWHNFLGSGELEGETRIDSADFARVTLNNAAKLSFKPEATAAAKFTVWSLSVSGTDGNGDPVYKMKSLKTVSLKKTKGVYAAAANDLWLEVLASDTDPNVGYYVSMETKETKSGVYYNVTLDTDKTAIYSDGDDGKNNWLYEKKSNDLNPDAGSFQKTTIDPNTGGVAVDREGSVSYDDGATIWSNFVGFGDTADFARITLKSAAKLSFKVDATAAAKFTVWSLTVSGTDGNGDPIYKMKSLKTVTLKKKNGVYTAMANDIWLEVLASSTDPNVGYYVSVEASKEKSGAYYNVTLNTAGKDRSEFYSDGVEAFNNNWLYDEKTNTLNPDRNAFETTMLMPDNVIVRLDCSDGGYSDGERAWDNFVGFGDTADFAQLELSGNDPAVASFSVMATGASKFTVWSLTVSGADGNGDPIYKMKSLKTVSLKKKNGVYTAAIQDLLLDRLASSDYNVGYYVSMQASNPKKNARVYYDVYAENIFGYMTADDGRNKYLYDKKADPEHYNPSLYTNKLSPGPENDRPLLLENEAASSYIKIGEESIVFINSVSFGDEWDYAEISLSAPGTLTFTVDAYDYLSDSKVSGGAAKASLNLKFTVYSLTWNANKKAWTQKTLASQTITVDKKDGYVLGARVKKAVTVKAATSDNVKYFVSMQSLGAAKGASVFYNVYATMSSSEGAALAMPESGDVLTMQDGLSLSQCDVELSGACVSSNTGLENILGETEKGLLASL